MGAMAFFGLHALLEAKQILKEQPRYWGKLNHVLTCYPMCSLTLPPTMEKLC